MATAIKQCKCGTYFETNRTATVECGPCREVTRRANANANRRARDAAYRSCGLVKVRGALGGTYWE